jgi:hypothetical protein
MSENKEKFVKPYFYYVRDALKRPVITVCLMHAMGIWVRGVAICSEKDQAVKRTGRLKAFDRAQSALLNQINSEPIQRRNQYIKQSEPSGITDFFLNTFSSEGGITYKSMYNPILTAFEKKLTSWEIKDKKEE